MFTTMWPSWYLVVGLSSMRSNAGRFTTGMRNSRASKASHVKTSAQVSHAINSASVGECDTVYWRDEAHAIGWSDARASRPLKERRKSGSAAKSMSV